MALTVDCGKGLGSVRNAFPRVEDVALLVDRIAAADWMCLAGGSRLISSEYAASRLVGSMQSAGQLREERAHLLGAALASPQ
jgi:hypothetical protein